MKRKISMFLVSVLICTCLGVCVPKAELVKAAGYWATTKVTVSYTRPSSELKYRSVDIPKGATVELIENTSSTWWRIKYKSYKVYVNPSCLHWHYIG